MRLSAELSYQRRAEKAMADENCFKIYIVSNFLKCLIYYSNNSNYIK